MNITFFGLKGTFDYYNIGGTDSFCRRLGFQLITVGKNVNFVHYGCDRQGEESVSRDFKVYSFRDFNDSLAYLEKHADVVIVNAIHRNDRLSFIKFRKKNKNIKYYYLASVFSESIIKRNLYLLDPLLYPYNGGVLAMSPRLANASRLRRNNSELLLPPVPDNYYVRPEDKPRRNKVVITYIGRTVPGKGADQAVEIFKGLGGEPNIEKQVCGYVWPDDREDKSIHNWLLRQNEIKYICEEYKGWSSVVDEKISETLRKTDILLLPYKWLSSTMDMPMLLLEGMAANCCIITKPLGDIPAVYGDSPFILPQHDFVRRAVELIVHVRNSRGILQQERQRVANQTAKWDFCTPSVTKRLLKLIG